MRRMLKYLVLILIILILAFMLSTIDFINYLIDPWNGLYSQAALSLYTHLTIKSANVKSEVCIYWDSNGVPYIKAYNVMDLYYAIGYVQAHDRLWQMDLLRRMALGNLSAIVGGKALESDKFFRILNIRKIAISTYEYMKSNRTLKFYAEILKAFSKGVNDYIDNAIKRGDLPFEFRLLGYKPERWRPWDTIAISKLMAWTLSGSFNDLNLYQLVKIYGTSIIDELKLIKRPLTKPIIHDTQRHGEEHGLDLILVLNTSLYSVKALSNSWVISGELSATNNPILCNDPHLPLTLPPIWYEMVIEVVGKFKVHGVTIPGIPFIIIGRNEKIAWGFTNSNVDVVDFYYYVWKGDKYFYNGTWINAVVRYEEIIVRKFMGIEKYILKVLETIHGPVIERNNIRLALRWTGLTKTLEFIAFYKLNTASNYLEAINAMKYFGAPPQNMLVADVYGNIAYKLIGLIPIRTQAMYNGIINYGFLPFNGSRCEGEWIGYVPFDELPKIVNPENGFIITANNMPINISKYKYYIGWNWHDRYRFERIHDLIKSRINKDFKLTLDDMMAIQLDIYEPEAPIILNLTLKILEENIGKLTDIEKKALKLLEKWNYEMKVDIPQPSIYYYYIYYLHYNIWSDELNAAGINDKTFIRFEVTEYVLRNEIQKPSSMYKWINSTLDEIVLKSFKDAIKHLIQQFGRDVNNWKWGKIHKYSIKHPLGEVINSLNLPKVPANGGMFTVNVAPWTDVNIGPGLRFIADLSSNKDLIIIAGGNSGNPLSICYDNQFNLWVKGIYRIVYLEVTPSNKVGSITIKPLT